MCLAARALTEVARWRGTRVFAIASQIFFADPNRRREETGCTEFRVKNGLAEIFNVLPADGVCVQSHLYAGGGASLFRRGLLQRFRSRFHPYNPVYWEDVEWSVRAWRAGYEVLFCAESTATHAHRATVSQIFSQEEVERIMRRNQLLFSLRNGFFQIPPRTFIQELRRNWDSTTQRELAALSQAISLLRAILWNAMAPKGDVPSDHLGREAETPAPRNDLVY